MFLVISLALSLGIITWESIASEYALPSRQTRSLIVHVQHDDLQKFSLQWGQVTIRGMGFGKTERQILMHHKFDDDDQANPDYSEDNGMIIDDILLPNRRSYNEVLLQHRQKTIPFWKHLTHSVGGDSDITSFSTELTPALGSLLDAMQSIPTLQHLANNYQWDALRKVLLSCLWQDHLNSAAAQLRQMRSTDAVDSATIGFDWGSCAWRHGCGAWSDWQESVDVLDSLLGVLEPKEVLFCIDIIERSIREVLAVIPNELWMANSEARQRYQMLPEYQPYVFPSSNEGDSDAVQDDDDDPYVQALRKLRVEL